MISYLRQKYYKYTQVALHGQTIILPFLEHLEETIPLGDSCLIKLAKENIEFLNICEQVPELSSLIYDWTDKKSDLAYLAQLMQKSAPKLPLEICNLLVMQTQDGQIRFTDADRRFALSFYFLQYEKDLNQRFSELYREDALQAYCWRKAQLKKLVEFFSQFKDCNFQVEDKDEQFRPWLKQFVLHMQKHLAAEIKELNWQIAECIHVDKESGRIMNMERQQWRKIFSLGTLEDSPEVDFPLRHVFNYAKVKNAAQPAKRQLAQKFIELVETASDEATLIQLTPFKTELNNYIQETEQKWKKPRTNFLTWLNPLNWIAYYRDKAELPSLKAMSQHLSDQEAVQNEPLQFSNPNLINAEDRSLEFPQLQCEHVIATGFSIEDASEAQLNDLLENKPNQAGFIPLYPELPGLAQAKRAALTKMNELDDAQELDEKTKKAIVKQAAKVVKVIGSSGKLVERNVKNRLVKAEQVSNDIKLLRQEIKNHKGNQVNLMQRLQNLENANRTILRENTLHNSFMADEHLKEFFNTVLARMTELLLARKVIASGQVQSLKDNTELTSSALQSLGHGLGGFVPGLSLVTTLVGMGHDTVYGQLKQKIARLESELFPSLSHIDKFAFELAMTLTWRYSEQVRQLSLNPDPGLLEKLTGAKPDNAVKMLANCMVVRVTDVLWSAAAEDEKNKVIEIKDITCDWLARQVMALDVTDACLFTRLGLDYKVLHKEGKRWSIKEVISHPGVEHANELYIAERGAIAANPKEYGYIKGNEQDIEFLDLVKQTDLPQLKSKKAKVFNPDYSSVPVILPSTEKPQEKQPTDIVYVVKKMSKQQNKIKQKLKHLKLNNGSPRYSHFKSGSEQRVIEEKRDSAQISNGNDSVPYQQASASNLTC
ncbi:MAG: hypothetical protein K0S11_1440 [Gammaproteobacteria bacterium]|nr:hypothetical protein [Gammaproteobacteria bacterium]